MPDNITAEQLALVILEMLGSCKPRRATKHLQNRMNIRRLCHQTLKNAGKTHENPSKTEWGYPPEPTE